MTDHTKILGIAFLAFGILVALVLILISVLMVLGMSGMLLYAAQGEGSLLGATFGIIGTVVIMVLFFLFMSLPHLLAGYTFLKRKKSSKFFGVIASVFSFFTFPLGTALAVYCFWFIFGEQGKTFYGN